MNLILKLTMIVLWLACAVNVVAAFPSPWDTVLLWTAIGLLVAHSPSFVSLVDWRSRTLVPGWTFDLAGFGVADIRAVELARGRMWVSDGYDLRAPGDPLDHAIFVFSIT